MERNDKFWKKKAKQQLSTIIFCVVVGLILINSIIFYTRIDLTENKAYSISKVSQDIARNVSDTIYIDYYVSPQLKTATPSPQQMIDVFEEYQSRSNGTVVFIERDPSTEENAKVVEEQGLQPQQIQVVEENQATYAVVYSGIVLSFQDQTRVIPFFLQPAILEYQITSKIQEMLTDDNRVVGILALDQQYQDPRTLEGISGILQGDFEVRNVTKSEKIDNDIDALFVIGASDIDNDTAYYVDQFLMTGKGVYFAADTVRVNISQGLSGVYQYTLLHQMLEHYGVIVEDTVVLDVYNKLIPINRGNGVQVLQQYPMWMTVSEENVNADSPVTSRFAGLDLYWTSPLTVLNNKKNYFTTLISSSKDAWLKAPITPPPNPDAPDDTASRKIYQLEPDGSGFQGDKKEENTKIYSVTESFLGPLTSAVEGGIISIPQDAVVEEYKSQISTARFLVTGSSLFASWLYQFTNANYNLVYLSNASDWLSSDEKLLQIKSRIVKDSRLNKIQDQDKKNTFAFLVKLWNIVIIPLIVIIIAVVVLLFRREISKKRY